MRLVGKNFRQNNGQNACGVYEVMWFFGGTSTIYPFLSEIIFDTEKTIFLSINKIYIADQ